jgi:hypothetical protein
MCSCVLQVSLKSHNLDRTNLDIDFESFWGTVALSVKAEFIQVQRITTNLFIVVSTV